MLSSSILSIVANCRLVLDDKVDNLVSEYKEKFKDPEYADDIFTVVDIVAEKSSARQSLLYLVKWEVQSAFLSMPCVRWMWLHVLFWPCNDSHASQHMLGPVFNVTHSIASW